MLVLHPNASCVLGFLAIPIVLIGELGCLIGLILQISKKRFKLALLTLFTMVGFPLLVVLGLLVGISMSEERAKETMALGRERGEEICAAIDAFAKTRGDLPSSLNELVPDYLDVLPTVPRSLRSTDQWEYDRGSDGEFSLSFSTQEWDCEISSTKSQWRCSRMAPLGDMLYEETFE